MAIVTGDCLLIQNIMHGISGLPEDSFVNTFHVQTRIGVDHSDLDDVAASIEAFYNEDHGAGSSIAVFLSPQVSRVVKPTIKMFNLSDATPRIPVYEEEWANQVDASDTAAAYPNEVALVMSFHAEFVSGTPSASRRNRIYVGPLNFSAGGISGGDPVGNVRPPLDSVLGEALIAGGQFLYDEYHDTVTDPGSKFKWVAYSSKLDECAEVVAGWVDNEWDTQRRRQLRATARGTFGP